MVMAHLFEVQIIRSYSLSQATVVDMLIEVAHKNDVIITRFPYSQLRDELLEKMVRGERASPSAWKYLACWSFTVVPADRPELLGRYAITIRVFFRPEPNNIQHHLPNPVIFTPVSMTSDEMVLNAIIAHPPNWLGRIRSFMLLATTLRVSVPTPNKLWNFRDWGTCLQSICVLQPQRMSTLYLRHMLLTAVILAFPNMTHKLLKFSIAN